MAASEIVTLGFRLVGTENAQKFLSTIDQLASAGSRFSSSAGAAATDPTQPLKGFEAELRKAGVLIGQVNTAYKTMLADPQRGQQGLQRTLEGLEAAARRMKAIKDQLATGIRADSLIQVPGQAGRYALPGVEPSVGYVQRVGTGQFQAFQQAGPGSSTYNPVGDPQRNRGLAGFELASALEKATARTQAQLESQVIGYTRGLNELGTRLDARLQAEVANLQAQGKRVSDVLYESGKAVIRFTDDLRRASGELELPAFGEGEAVVRDLPRVLANPDLPDTKKARAELARELNTGLTDYLGDLFPESRQQLQQAQTQAAYNRGTINAGDLRQLPELLQRILTATPTQIATGELPPTPDLAQRRAGERVATPAFVTAQQVDEATFSREMVEGLRAPIASIMDSIVVQAQQARTARVVEASRQASIAPPVYGPSKEGFLEATGQASLFPSLSEAARATEQEARAAAGAARQLDIFDAELTSVGRALRQLTGGGGGDDGRVPPTLGGAADEPYEPFSGNPPLAPPGFTTEPRRDKSGTIRGTQFAFDSTGSPAYQLTSEAAFRKQAQGQIQELARQWSDAIGQATIDGLDEVKGSKVFEGLSDAFEELRGPGREDPNVSYAQEILGARLGVQPSTVTQPQVNSFLKTVQAELLAFGKSATAAAVGVDTLGRNATQAARLEDIANRQGLPKLYAEFQEGFRGRRGIDFAEQIGQTAKFSLLYGTAYQALYAFRQGMATAVQEAVAYNSALTDLAIATSSTKEEVSGLGERLSNVGTAYGLSPSAGLEAGTRAVGIFDLNNAAPNVRDYETENFTRAVSQLTFVTGRDVTQITEDVGSIAQAFGLAASQAQQVQDVDAFFSRRFGSQLGGTLETVAQIGSIATSAGFSLEETAALAAKLQSRTGQTPQAVAGLLSQFLGRSGDPALASKLAQLGIDTSQPFKEQITQLGQQDLSQSQRLFIENAFGRGRSGQAASIIIQDFEEILGAAKEAETGAAGLGEKQLAERMKTVGGALAKLGGDVKALAVDIGNSGLLDIVALLVKLLDAFVVGVSNVLTIWNELPRALRDSIIALAAFTAVLKYARGTELATQAGGLLNLIKNGPGRAAAGAPTDALGIIPTQLRGGTAATGLFAGARTAVNASGVGQAITAITGLSAVTFGTVAALAGLTFVAAEGVAQWKEHNQAMANATAAYGTLLGATTSSDYSAGADQLRAEAKTLDDAQGFLLNALTLGGAERSADKRVEQLRADADFLEQAAETEKTLENLAAGAEDITVFGDPAAVTIDDLGKGMQALAQQGVTATRSLALLLNVMTQIGDAKQALYDPEAAGNRYATNLRGAFGSLEGFGDLGFTRPAIGIGTPSRAGQPGLYNPDLNGPQFGADIPIDDAYINSIVSSQLPDLDEIKAKFKEEFGKKRPNKQQLQTFTSEELLADVEFPDIPNGPSGDELKAAWIQLITNNMEGLYDKYKTGRVLSDQEITQLLQGNGADFQGALAAFDASLQRLQELGFSEGTTRYQEELQKILAGLRKTQAKSDDGRGPLALRDAIQTYQDQIVGGAISRLEQMRAVAEAGVESDKRLRAIRQAYGQREINKLFSNGRARTTNYSIIADVISRASDVQVETLRSSVRQAIQSLRVKLEADRAVLETIQAAGPKIDAAIGIAVSSEKAVSAAIKKWEDRIGRLRKLLGGIGEAIDLSGVGSAYAGDYDTGADEPTDTPAQIAAARAVAEAARRGGAIAQAQAQLQAARADLAAAEPNTVAYYSALQGVYEAQRALSEAIRAYKIDKWLLGQDITDPLVQARAELRRANQQLRYDQRMGASVDQIAADRLAVREAEANKEATAFQQWMSDLQTAEQLEKISHSQYIRMLERRADRLKDIKNRTRQEQDQLNEVLLALKAAKESMSAQFNLGDIRVPTPYEVRRYIEQQKAATLSSVGAAATANASGGGGLVQNYNNNVRIDGADTGKVERIVRDLLGRNAIKSTSTKAGKV